MKSIIEAPYKAFYLAVPFLASLFIGWGLIGIDDTVYVLTWCIYLFLLALPVLPLGAFLFKGAHGGGYILTQTLGIVAVSLFTWTLTHLKIYMFTRPLLFLAMVVIAFICYLAKPLREAFIKEVKKPYYIEKLAIELTVFTVVFTILCFYKGFTPSINGQEKFMDYGFVMSMVRSPKLPAVDMWLSGYSINYYYFGQFIWAMVIKLSGTPGPVGYNLAMTSAIAIPFAMAFGIGTMLFGFMSERTNHIKGIWAVIFRYITGTFAGFTTILFGNSHSFFYDENSVGNGILQILSKWGVNVGKTTEFYYPDSTRFIGHNPDSQILDAMGNIIDEGDYTIEEFPFYSFLVADLHAHVISMMVVLLIMGIAICCLANTDHPDSYEYNVVPKRISKAVKIKIFKTEYRRLLTPGLVAMSVLLGVAQMTNFWDFLIYFIFGSMTLLIINTRRSKVFTDISGFICFAVNVAAILLAYLNNGGLPFVHVLLQMLILVFSYLLVCFEPNALTRTSFGMSFMFTVAFITALPFNAGFDMISNSLGKVTHSSSLYQLIILWGLHVLIALLFILFTVLYKNYDILNDRELKARSKQQNSSPAISDIPAEGFANPVAAFIGRRNIIDVFACGMVLVALLLIAAPEIFYVRDIYTSGYLRANTMFKFTFAAFIILGMSISYGIMRMLWITTSRNRHSVATLIVGIASFVLVCIIPGHYMFVGMKQRCGDTTILSNYQGLDGTCYLTDYYSPDGYIEVEGNLNSYYEAITWLNDNVTGSPVIAEAYGESYHDNNIVSAYTGLPTVIGWQTHEWLWRFHGIVDEESDLLISDPDYDVWDIYLSPRHNDIDMLYLSDDPEVVRYVINKYGIEYIILGNLEYYKYDYDNTETFKQVGEIVFTSENLNIFKVTPSDTAAG
ncbi:Chlor_Arch_YYY domain-containing protein [Ruminococcaceae bacterium YRB3002]|nr:Chlor_Arch_YYY domain-containing protein [Ruminococcaceae bacterium YRB3002]